MNNDKIKQRIDELDFAIAQLSDKKEECFSWIERDGYVEALKKLGDERRKLLKRLER